MPSTFNCLTCNPDKPVEMSFDEMRQHLREVHKLTELKGKKTAKLYLDGAKGYHRQDHEWNFGWVRVYEVWESE